MLRDLGAQVYFERAVVVSRTLHTSESRLLFFASLNTAISLVILLLQLRATARLLAWLGVPAGLLASPLLCVAGFLAIALHPTPAVVAGARHELIGTVLSWHRCLIAAEQGLGVALVHQGWCRVCGNPRAALETGSWLVQLLQKVLCDAKIVAC
jgi:hypothetical protein